eukprot:779252_1
MTIDLVLVPTSNCCIFIIHLLFLVLAILAFLNGSTYCVEEYAQEPNGSFSASTGGGCDEDSRCHILQDGQIFISIPGQGFACTSSEDCVCDHIGTTDPAFTTLVVCALFFFVKLLIEFYLIYCANYLSTNNFKPDSKKILRVAESVWLRCVQCRAQNSWHNIMQAYETGHFYVFKERVFYISTFINLVFVIIAIIGYVDLNQSAEGIALFLIVGACWTLILMCFSCFVKYKYIQWAQSSDEEDDDDELNDTEMHG